MKKYKYFLFNFMDGIVFVNEIYFWDLYDFGLFFFILEREKNDKSVLMNIILKLLLIKEMGCYEDIRLF